MLGESTVYHVGGALVGQAVIIILMILYGVP